MVAVFSTMLVVAAASVAWKILPDWSLGGQPVPPLSIVVLPFANLAGDAGQQYLVDGISEDLTTDLSRLADMLVISRDTAFTYKDKPVNAKQIGRELGVRYVLEGSVQRSGNNVRINARLIDTTTDTHLWAERFRPQHRRPINIAERNHQAHSGRTQSEADCLGGGPTKRTP